MDKIYSKYGYLISVTFVMCATAVFYLGRNYLAKGQWALLYLLVVLAVASMSGTRPAILAAALSFLTWNFFFIPPYKTLSVHDPKDWLFLFIFLIVAIIVGFQAGRLKQRETLALSREHETDLLKNFSAGLVANVSLKEFADLLVDQINKITINTGVFLPNGHGNLQLISFKGNFVQNNQEIEKIAKWSYSFSKAIGLPDINDINNNQLLQISSAGYDETGFQYNKKDIFLPFQSTSKRLGVLYIGEKDAASAFSAREIELLKALLYQASAFLERKELQQLEITAKARNQSDKFRSAIISSIHHELKTPLSSINATVTNLLEKDTELNSDELKEEHLAIKKDLNRLNSSIGSLVDLSRLETADWEPKKDWYELGEILGNTLSRIPAKERKRITIQEIKENREINVDFIQIGRVLQIIIENALAYSGNGNKVKIGASFSNKNMEIFIEDNGPGIDCNDKEHIFDKFYRGKTANSPGTGLGLAIALELINFHGGNISVKDAKPQGARFVIILPAKKRNYWE